MLAGPIIKYFEIAAPLRDRVESWDDRATGILRFLWGLARKVLVADVCGDLVDRIFALPPGG
jgi:alginate O-acetyltransferase complex protein AlgI